MNQTIIKLALETMRIIFIIFVIFGFTLIGYLYLESDMGLLSDESLISIISKDVLGNYSYGNSCPRSSYESTVNIEPGGTKGSGYFTFNPVKGQEIQCPSISIIVSRRTGEAWIAGR